MHLKIVWPWSTCPEVRVWTVDNEESNVALFGTHLPAAYRSYLSPPMAENSVPSLLLTPSEVEPMTAREREESDNYPEEQNQCPKIYL